LSQQSIDNDDFQIRTISNKFEKLIKILSADNIIDLLTCEIGKKTKIKNLKIFSELLYFFILFHSGYKFNKEKNCLEIQGNGLNITINPTEKDILSKLIPNEDIINFEEIINSLIAIYIASIFEEKDLWFKFLYPNAYIKELGERTHEIDIIGRIVGKNINKKLYLVIETTLGYFKERNENIDIYDITSHNWHFKKAIFKKWAIERIFNVEIHLIYLTIRNLKSLEDSSKDKFLEKILDIDKNVRVVSFFEDQNTDIVLKFFADNYMDNFELINKNLLNPLRDNILQFLKL